MAGLKTISQKDDGTRLDKWFANNFPGLAISSIQKFARKGEIRVNGKRIKASYILKENDVIRIPPQTQKMAINALDARQIKKRIPPLIAAEKIQPYLDTLKQAILWQDDNFLIINKPCGLAVQGGSKTPIHLDMLLNHYEKIDKNIFEKPRLTHRLDRDTSGILLLAKNAEAAKDATHCFKERMIKKLYWAYLVSDGSDDLQKSGSISLKLRKKMDGHHHMEKMQLDDEEGLDAVTRYWQIDKQFINKNINISKNTGIIWMAFSPITGRTHQLRIHAALSNAPILGDGKYGGKKSFPICAGGEKIAHLYLHARAIYLPATLLKGKGAEEKADMHYIIKAPPPDDFINIHASMGFANSIEKGDIGLVKKWENL